MCNLGALELVRKQDKLTRTFTRFEANLFVPVQRIGPVANLLP